MAGSAVRAVGALLLPPRLGVLAFPLIPTIGYAINAALSLPIALHHLSTQSAAVENCESMPSASTSLNDY